MKGVSVLSKQIKTLFVFLLVLAIAVPAVNVIGSAFSDKVTYYTFGGNAYEVVNTNYTYTSAKSAANRKGDGGHILNINSQAEQNFIMGIAPGGIYWLGAVRQSSGWTWENGGNVAYANWEGGTTPTDSIEKYAFIDTSSGAWHQCERSRDCMLIVEYEGAASKVKSANETGPVSSTTGVTGDDPQTGVSATSVTETGTGSETGSETDSTQSTTRQQITYVYIRETAASNFTLPPSVTQPGDPNEPETTNILSQLDIGDTIFVYDDFYYQIADASEVIIAYYIGSDSDITIPSSIDGMPVKYISHRAFQNTKLSSATIPGSVIYIDPSAFCNVDENFTIYGERDSEAQIYANESGFTFNEVSFLGSDNPGKNNNGADEITKNEESNRKVALIVLVLAAVVAAAAVIAFFVVRREKILSAMEEEDEDSAKDDKPSYSVEYDDGSGDEAKAEEKPEEEKEE